ncbi:peptidoglycan-binding domain-containing protein [Streptomyces aurantiogriseus]|uniref:peptidoglycan-binding domain-containing protein n=1 Tax=Streptomyces aurantiogriseus TaxID=66870 RepID=UPI001E546369|nr:peptidoglycan-binding domain-containing protein [Streptomyces aurantiogriseus]
MNEPMGQQGRPGRHGLPCPECGALRAPDNTPSCTCAQRASEALRDARVAEAAAAGDFDPLRIRPYVELGEQGPGAGTEDSAASDVTAPLPSVSDATMPLRAVNPSGPAPETAALPTPLAPTGSPPSATDLSLFEAGDSDRGGAYADRERPRGRRRRTLLIASAAAAVSVIAAAGFASGLFSYEKPTRDSAAPEDVRAAVPDTSTSAASPSASSASPSPSESESASPSPSESESPSPSPSASSASPSASATSEPSPSTPTARATGSLTPGNGADNAAGDGADDAAGSSPEATVLRRGDRGDEVTELQLRLKQLFLYNDDANGVFTSKLEEALRNYQWSRGIQGDELGVYGAATREKLESETKEP